MKIPPRQHLIKPMMTTGLTEAELNAAKLQLAKYLRKF